MNGSESVVEQGSVSKGRRRGKESTRRGAGQERSDTRDTTGGLLLHNSTRGPDNRPVMISAAILTALIAVGGPGQHRTLPEICYLVNRAALASVRVPTTQRNAQFSSVSYPGYEKRSSSPRIAVNWIDTKKTVFPRLTVVAGASVFPCRSMSLLPWGWLPSLRCPRSNKFVSKSLRNSHRSGVG